jgi:4-hydroxy-tetrahydrodipicolinate synthase
MVALWRAFASGDIATARALQSALFPLFTALFVETNPVPVKTALQWHTGLPTAAVRLPLVGLEESSVEALRKVCTPLGIGA